MKVEFGRHVYCLAFVCIINTKICRHHYPSLEIIIRNHAWLLLALKILRHQTQQSVTKNVFLKARGGGTEWVQLRGLQRFGNRTYNGIHTSIQRELQSRRHGEVRTTVYRLGRYIPVFTFKHYLYRKSLALFLFANVILFIGTTLLESNWEISEFIIQVDISLGWRRTRQGSDVNLRKTEHARHEFKGERHV